MADAPRAFLPYPDYKDSGLPWLGRIPVHWEVRRNGALFAQRVETSFPELPVLEVSLHTGVRVRELENSARKQVMSDFAKYKRAAVGDIAYNMMRMWQGTVGVAPCDGLISPAYVVARPFPHADSRYYAYLYRTSEYMAEFNKYSHGIVSDRNRLYWDEFKQMPAPVPPRSEQQAIADFLDAHARLVRRFIRNKRQLIAFLEDQRQALIQRAVTRGLDPMVRLKPSGIEWLGDVPSHWEVRRLKILVRNVNEQTDSKLPDEAYLALEHVQSWTGRVILPKGEVGFDSQVKRFQPNDILFGKLRPYLAKVTRPQMRGVCVSEFLVLRVADKSILPEYLEEKLRSKQLIDLTNSSTFGAKMPRTEWAFIGNLRIAYPQSHEEQRTILDQIHEETATHRTAMARAQREIDLIREYRTRLVADVVTGHVDVRGLAAELPDVPKAQTALDEGDVALGDGLGDDEEPEPPEEGNNGDE